jgi:hypothetical protein
MRLNPSKCMTLYVRAGTKARTRSTTVFVDPTPILEYEGTAIPAMVESGSYKYLGLRLTPKGYCCRGLEETLRDQLRKLSRSYLNPQQRLWGLKVCVIPGLYHQLALGRPSMGFLRKLDRMVRGAVRKWLHMPADTPLGVFHAKVADGGLGIPELVIRVRRLARERLERMCGLQCPIVGALRWDESVAEDLRMRHDPVIIGDVAVTNAVNESILQRKRLETSHDGRAIAKPASAAGTRWIGDPINYRISGGEYVKAVLTKYQLLKTGERKTRGVNRSQGGRLCRICQVVQSLAHIVQMCPMTHGLVVRRHDDLVRALASSARRLGWTVIHEPRIACKTSFLKPDLVLLKKGKAFVLDPSITGCRDDAVAKGRDKVNKYRVKEVQEYVRSVSKAEGHDLKSLTIEPVLVSWRGTWEPATVKLLRGLKIPRKFMDYSTVRLLNSGWRMWHLQNLRKD